MNIGKIIATAVTRVPTVQYGFVERTFTLEATPGAEDDIATCIEILKSRLLQSLRDGPAPAVTVSTTPAPEVPQEPAAAPTAPEPEVRPEPEAAPVAEDVSDADFSTAIAAHVKLHGTAKVLELRSQYGAASVSDIKGPARREFIKALGA